MQCTYMGLVSGMLGALAIACSGSPAPSDGSSDAGMDVSTMSEGGNDAGMDVSTMSEGGNDAGMDVSTMSEGGNDAGLERTYTYVINSLTIDPDDFDPKHGFDLDNLFSTGTGPHDCDHEDFFARYPEDNDQNCPMAASDGTCRSMPNPGCAMSAAGCRGGVDNQLPAIVSAAEAFFGTNVREQLNDVVSQNRFALLVRVTGVSSLMNDDGVRVFVYRGFPTFRTNCNTVEPGRTYQIDRASLRSGGTTLDDAVVVLDGRIVSGRLQGRAGSGWIDLPIVNIRVHSPLLRVNLTDTAGSSGNMGGMESGSRLRDELVRMAPSFESTIDTIVGGFVDIEAMGVCFDGASTPPRFGNIGVGLGFTMVEARIAETDTFVTSQMPGTCGYSDPSDGGSG